MFKAVAVGMAVLVGFLAFGSNCDSGLRLFRLADGPALKGGSEEGKGAGLYVLVIPEPELAVIIRPLSLEEYGAFQIQAIDHLLIERQMVAAALVLPRLDEGEIPSLPPAVVALIERAVNEVSGFVVFPRVAMPEAGG